MARYFKHWPCCVHCNNDNHPRHGGPCFFCDPCSQVEKTERYPQAKDIADEEFYTAMNPAPATTQMWELELLLAYPEKVIRAKARTLILKRKTIDGCWCGCRGDFQFIENSPEMQVAQIVSEFWKVTWT